MSLDILIKGEKKIFGVTRPYARKGYYTPLALKVGLQGQVAPKSLEKRGAKEEMCRGGGGAGPVSTFKGLGGPHYWGKVSLQRKKEKNSGKRTLFPLSICFIAVDRFSQQIS